MLEKKIDTMHLMLQGLIFILMGMVIMLMHQVLMWRIVIVFEIGFFIISIFTFCDWLLHMHRKERLIYAIAEFGLAFFLATYPHIPVAILPILFGCLMLMHAVVHGITTYIYFSHHASGRIKELMLTGIYLLLGITMFLEPLVYVGDLMFLIGLYLCLYGIKNLKDALMEEMKIDTKNKMRRKVRLPLPVLFASLIPHRVLTYINHFFKESHEEPQAAIVEYKEEVEPDLEVLIHVTDKGYGAFGHVDICYHGYIISYGNYDAASYHLHDCIGDGVLFVAPKEKYIPFCIADSQKTLFGFGMVLNDEMKREVNRKIYDIFQKIEPWYPDYQIALEKHDEKTMQESLEYYANRLYKNTKAKMYKFKSGPFKTYFVLKTNCVALADAIIGKTGIDIVDSNGIISPGSYYEYFNNEFMKSSTRVVTRTIYH